MTRYCLTAVELIERYEEIRAHDGNAAASEWVATVVALASVVVMSGGTPAIVLREER